MYIACSVQSQQIVDLEENTPCTYNGLEYGFYITNERSKEVKGEDYDRYEINLFVTNKSGCIKLIPLKTNSSAKTGDKEVVANSTAKMAPVNG